MMFSCCLSSSKNMRFVFNYRKAVIIPELDKRVGDYAAAILRDADLLLADAANMTKQQQEFAGSLKRIAVRLVSTYDEFLAYCIEGTVEPAAILHEVRLPLSSIRAYCDLLLSGQI